MWEKRWLLVIDQLITWHLQKKEKKTKIHLNREKTKINLKRELRDRREEREERSEKDRRDKERKK